MVSKFDYYDIVSKRLNHQSIIRDIKIANEYFRRGDIRKCRDILTKVVAAIEQALKEALE